MMLRTITLVLTCLPVFALAQSRPTEGTRGSPGEIRGVRGERGMRPEPRPRPEAASAEALLFFQQHSPARWQVIEGLAPEQKEAMQRRIATRLRNLATLQRPENGDLLDLTRKQIAVEDRIFGMLQRLRSRPGDESLQRELREQIGVLVRLRLEERSLQIERLKATVAEQSALLEKDRQRVDELVQREFDAAVAVRRPMRGGLPLRPGAAGSEGQTRSGDRGPAPPDRPAGAQ